MDNGFSSPRMEAFPAGLRVLVVDDDLAWLRILEKMLKKCAYEVSTCCFAKEALDLLRERKYGFDIVISDVNMPDMDGFKLLEHIGLEMDLPVIMMSVDGETSRVMRGVQHGACDYLLKPIRMKELRNIWQHVLRKRIREVRDIEGFDEFQIRKLEHYDTGKKRKDHDDKLEEGEHGDPTVKKARVVWTVDLHQKFVTAVNQIGFDKVGPKKILDLMNVPKLTRENVASHLQKYRLYLSRLQEGSKRKACFGATKQSDISTKEMKSINPKHYDDDMKNIVSLPIQEQMKTPFCNISDTPKTSILRIGSIHNFRPQEPNTPFDPMISEKYVQNEIPKVQFKKENVVNQLDHVPIVQFVSSRPSITESKRMTFIETKTQEASGNNQLLLHDPGSGPESLISESCLDFASGNGDLFSFFLQSDTNYKTNVEPENKECCIPNIPELFDETVAYLYYPQKLNYEYQWEATEYPVIDQGLFMI